MNNLTQGAWPGQAPTQKKGSPMKEQEKMEAAKVARDRAQQIREFREKVLSLRRG